MHKEGLEIFYDKYKDAKIVELLLKEKLNIIILEI